MEQSNKIKTLAEINAASVFLFDVNLDGIDCILEIECFKGKTSNSLDVLDQEVYHENGLIYSILSEDTSHKMMATFKTKQDLILGVTVITRDTKYGYLDLDHLGICHQYVLEAFRSKGIAKMMFDGICHQLVLLGVSSGDFYMQDHMIGKYQSNNFGIKSYIWDDLIIEE